MINRYMIVDDDPINNKLCSYVIKQAVPGIDIKSFEYPLPALAFIVSDYGDANTNLQTILFLDINMPELSGWEFLDEFAKMDKHIHQQFTIFILSSSIDYQDVEKAKANVFVKDFLSKPLSPSVVKEIANSRLLT